MKQASSSDRAFAALCQDIIARLASAHGLTATFEYPGCIAVQHAGGSWWFGTANDTWQGDLLVDGQVLDTRATDVTIYSGDPGKIAQGIAKALGPQALAPSCPAHGYGVVAATVTVTTTSGTFHLCEPCATSFASTPYFVSKGALASENPYQRCQCEHASHFAEGSNVDAQ